MYPKSAAVWDSCHCVLFVLLVPHVTGSPFHTTKKGSKSNAQVVPAKTENQTTQNRGGGGGRESATYVIYVHEKRATRVFLEIVAP